MYEDRCPTCDGEDHRPSPPFDGYGVGLTVPILQGHDPTSAPLGRVESISIREAVVREMARIDAEHPLPEPPAMPGQVWAWLDSDGEPRCLMDATGGYIHPPGAFLVDGPTPWGRGVPWAPA